MSLQKPKWFKGTDRLWTEALILSKWDEIYHWRKAYAFSVPPMKGQLKTGEVIQIVGFTTRLFWTSMSITPYDFSFNSLIIQKTTKTGKIQKGVFLLFIRGVPDTQTERLSEETEAAFWESIKNHIAHRMIKKFINDIARENANEYWHKQEKIPRIVMEHLEYTTDFCKMMDELVWKRERERDEAGQRRLETDAKIFREEINDAIDRYSGRDPLLPAPPSPVGSLQDQYNKVTKLFNEILTAHKYEAIDFMMEEYLKEKAKLLSLSGGKAGLVGLKKELHGINFPYVVNYGLGKHEEFGKDIRIPTYYPEF